MLFFRTQIADPRVRNVVGWLGYKSDRKLAIRALKLASLKGDVHSIFAALTLMTYYGMVLFMSGWQADLNGVIESYKGVLIPQVCSFSPIFIHIIYAVVGLSRSIPKGRYGC